MWPESKILRSRNPLIILFMTAGSGLWTRFYDAKASFCDLVERFGMVLGFTAGLIAPVGHFRLGLFLAVNNKVKPINLFF